MKMIFGKNSRSADKSIYDQQIKEIEQLLEPCPLCKDKAEVLAVLIESKGLIIDAVGCFKCHLVVERKWDIPIDNTPKLFSKWSKSEIDVVEIWNRRKE